MGDFQLTVYDDDAGSPGDQLWQAVPSSVANTDTGDDAWGFDLYHTIMDLDSADFFQAASGTTYWVEIYGTGTSIFYWLCADGGNMHRNGTDLGYDAFFRVLGTVNTAIHESTWGGRSRPWTSPGELLASRTTGPPGPVSYHPSRRAMCSHAILI